MGLIEEIESKKKEYFTDGYPMSIGEITNLYSNDELIINPDFQRFFRWTIYQKTRFIESIFLGIPIPSIFIYQRADGVWELVDGLQRISSILEFMNILKGKEPIPLEGTENLPGLKDMVWEKLPMSLKLQFKRSKIDVKIITKESDVNAKFDVFERINTGGSFLSEQEVRNSLLIMLNKNIYNWLKDLSEYPNFRNCISISDRLISEQYDTELVLRYLSILKFNYDKQDISSFLSDSLKRIVKEGVIDLDLEGANFKKLFDILSIALGDNCFKKYDFVKNEFRGKFLESAFESITYGLGYHIDYYTDSKSELVKEKIIDMWQSETFTNYSGSGSNAKTRIPNLIKFAYEYFRI